MVGNPRYNTCACTDDTDGRRVYSHFDLLCEDAPKQDVWLLVFEVKSAVHQPEMFSNAHPGQALFWSVQSADRDTMIHLKGYSGLSSTQTGI